VEAFLQAEDQVVEVVLAAAPGEIACDADGCCCLKDKGDE
jgi:hypothetical protein